MGAIAATGHSDAILTRLRAAEAEQAEQQQAANAAPAARVDAARAFAALRLNLLTALEHDRERARALVADLVGPVALEVRDGEVWGRMDAGRAELLATGTSTTVVAGARTNRWIRFR